MAEDAPRTAPREPEGGAPPPGELADPDHDGPPDREGWDELMAVLDRVPFVSGLKRDLTSLSRLVVLGRPGSGRHRLLGALLGDEGEAPEAEGWRELLLRGRRVDWVSIDVTDDDPEPSLRAARAAADARRPDAVLLVATPEEVRRGLGVHLEVFSRALATLEEDGARPAAFAVMSRADTLIDDGVILGHADPNVSDARARFARQLREAGGPTEEVFAVAAPPGRRETFGAAKLAEALVASLPEAARIEGARSFEGAADGRRRVARDLVQCCSTLAITVSLTPLPFSDLAVMAPLQGMMVTTLAYLSGRAWDRRTAAEWIASVGVVGGAGMGFRWGAQQLAKLVPGMGSIFSAGIAGAGTLALGRSATRYFLGITLPK